MQPKGWVGISVSAQGVSVVRVVRDEGRAPRLEACAFRPCEAVAHQDKVLGELMKDYGLMQARCVRLMEPGSYHLLLVEAPNVATPELKAAVRWRIKDLIDFHVDDAVIDVFDIPGQGVQGRPKMMYVVVARAALVQSYVDRAEEARLNLTVIDIPELALRNITALLPEDDAGVALLHLDPQGGHIILTRQSDLYLARNIEVAAEHLAHSGTELAPPLQRALDGVILEIQRSLDYYESHYAQPPITHLYVTPLEKEAPGLMEYIGANLSVAVRQLDVNQLLQCTPPLNRALQARCLLGIGAALRTEQRTL
ncbi:MAG: agglutinin biogenesis protein MshI [Pseudomonadota bacterium]